MITNLIVLIVLIVSAFAYIKIAEHYNIVDNPNHRSSHSEPIIRGAGVLFFIAAVIFFIVSGWDFPYFFAGLTLIAVISYVDDLVSLSSKIRLVFQFVSIGLVIYQFVMLTELPLLYIPLLLIVGVGFINIFNFMDGINGITGLYALVAFLGLYIINYSENIIDERLFVFIIISILVFGFFNFRKRARFFCGDVGSISLAIVLFFIIALFSIQLESPLFVLLMGVYLTDAILTIFYRKYLGENITDAHRHHIYQKLTDKKKFPHLKTSALYAFFQAIILLIIWLTYKEDLTFQLIVFIGISVLLILLYIFLFKWLKKVTIDNEG